MIYHIKRRMSIWRERGKQGRAANTLVRLFYSQPQSFQVIIMFSDNLMRTVDAACVNANLNSTDTGFQSLGYTTMLSIS